ncbi:hypothetical protein FVE85_9165 [Porphyridium purpureum]|uniref:Uncharacterized protein n=1 Tax=Porphyridium purpureum TaxID=35688 RepID=A0A5J4YQ58_PORPP|nr:hypothetical protein FVE85_9165 [Porphyridium purpureum]|eukprot:POR5242..scf222_8
MCAWRLVQVVALALRSHIVLPMDVYYRPPLEPFLVERDVVDEAHVPVMWQEIELEEDGFGSHELSPQDVTPTSSGSSASALFEAKRKSHALKRLQLFAYQLVFVAVFLAYELPVFLTFVFNPGRATDVGLHAFGISFFALLPVCTLAIIGSLRHEAIQRAWEREQWPESPAPPKWLAIVRLLVSGLVAVFPVKMGKRRRLFGPHRHFPWMALLISSVWVLMHIVNPPGSGGIYSFCDYSQRCKGTAVTFCNLIANFQHVHTRGLIGNIAALFLFSAITEVSYGSWRAFLPVFASVPWLLPIYGQCNSIGGSGILGLLAGNFVAVWFGELAWAGRLCEWFGFFECLSAGLLSVFCANFFGGVTSAFTSGTNVAHWVHACAQILGFCMTLIILPFFDRWATSFAPEHECGYEFGFQQVPREPPYTHSKLWCRWFNSALALVGVVASAAFLCLGFLNP